MVGINCTAGGNRTNSLLSSSAGANGTRNAWRRTLFEIHLVESFAPLLETIRTGGKLFQIPQVSEHTTALKSHTVFRRGFECVNSRRREIAACREHIQLFRSKPSGNQRHNGCATVEREVDRTPRQGEGFFVATHERRSDDDKGTERNVMLTEKLCRARKYFERHSLVQLRQDFVVGHFQTHCYFEFYSREQVTKLYGGVLYQRGMTFHNHSLEILNAFGNRREVLWWNGLWIEKAPGVVKFDLFHVGGTSSTSP